MKKGQFLSNFSILPIFLSVKTSFEYYKHKKKIESNIGQAVIV